MLFALDPNSRHLNADCIRMESSLENNKLFCFVLFIRTEGTRISIINIYLNKYLFYITMTIHFIALTIHGIIDIWYLLVFGSVP